jgi:hypothetical protein
LQLPQVYKVQYKNQNGCTAIDSFTLKNNDPIIPVKYNDQTVCKGDTVELITFESNGIQYQNKQWKENGVLQSNPNAFKKPIHQNTVLEFSATGSQFNITCTEHDTMQINLHPANTNRLQILKTDTCLKSNEIQANMSWQHQYPKPNHCLGRWDRRGVQQSNSPIQPSAKLPNNTQLHHRTRLQRHPKSANRDLSQSDTFRSTKRGKSFVKIKAQNY